MSRRRPEFSSIGEVEIRGTPGEPLQAFEVGIREEDGLRHINIAIADLRGGYTSFIAGANLSRAEAEKFVGFLQDALQFFERPRTMAGYGRHR